MAANILSAFPNVTALFSNYTLGKLLLLSILPT
jgi:hypothetical protein